MADVFDVIVLGGGPAGENVAGRVAAAGLKTVLVEAERVGGECSFWACMPSKALLRPVEELDAARHTPGIREMLHGRIDAGAVLHHRDWATSGYNDASQVKWLDEAKVELARGVGRISGVRKVTVTSRAGTRELEARRAVVVATGSRAFIPDIPGLRDARPWTNREGTAAKSVPKRLLVVGGGPVSVELAQAWKALGSEEVTLLVRDERLLARMDPFAGELVAKGLQETGVKLRFRTELTQVRRDVATKEVTAKLSDGSSITANELLVATGRVPATQDLGLESVGLSPGKSIAVDDSLRATGVPGDWLYACGDVCGRNLLTHMGKYQGRLVADAILGKQVSAWADHSATPQVVFTEPQAASVGLIESAARAKGLRIRALQTPIESVAGATLMGGYERGVAQIVVDEDRRVIVGATFVGPGVAEMLHAATIAIVGEVPLDRLWHAVPSFPTVSEVWLRLLEAYGL
jgi:dihydrolipoamide dehydrogenase